MAPAHGAAPAEGERERGGGRQERGRKNGSPTPARAGREPTVQLPAGMQIAQPKVRGMALLFDLAIVIVLLTGVQFFVPNLIQSDYKDKVSQITSLDKASSAQGDIKDANQSIDDANQAISKAESSGKQGDLQSAQSDLKSAQSDLKDAQKDFDDAQKDFNEKQKSQGLDDTKPLPTSTKQLDSMSSNLTDDIRTTQYVTALVTLVLAPDLPRPDHGDDGEHVRHARPQDQGRAGRRLARRAGTRCSRRFIIPLLIALAIPTLGPIVAIGIVLWGYRDPNGQGVHDKLARTLVVDA